MIHILTSTIVTLTVLCSLSSRNPISTFLEVADEPTPSHEVPSCVAHFHWKNMENPSTKKSVDDFCSKIWFSSMDSHFRLSDFRICSKRTPIFFHRDNTKWSFSKVYSFMNTIMGEKKGIPFVKFPDGLVLHSQKKNSKKSLFDLFFVGCLGRLRSVIWLRQVSHKKKNQKKNSYFPLNPGCLIRILMSWFMK